MSDETTENFDEIDTVAEVTESSGDNAPSMSRTYLVIGGIVLASLLAVAGYLYLERNRTVADTTDAKDAKEEMVVSVKTITAKKEHIAQEFTTVGTVAPAEQSIVSASISAQITQMPLLKNQVVKRGDVLAVLASKDLQAQRSEATASLEEARLNLQTLQNVTIPQADSQTEKDLADTKANADNARATYTRRKDLYEKGGLSLKELEASQLALTNAENALRLIQKNARLNRAAVNPNARAIAESKIKQAQTRIQSIDTQIGLAKVVAPISGVVTDQFQFDGEFASQGAKLFTIANIAQVIIKAQFADTIAANLHEGDLVNVYPSGMPDEMIGGRIALISRSADSQNRTFEVWANFGNPRGILRVGDAVQFVVALNPTDDAIVLPLAAVTLDASNGDEGVVMTVDKDNVAHETKVKIGVRNKGKVQILEGLEEDQTVVVEGNYGLPDGTKVEIAEESSDGEKTDEK